MRRQPTEQMIQGLRERLQLKSRRMPNGCIEWTGHTNRGGYGDTTLGYGNHVTAHRAAYAFANGLSPAFYGGVIRHTCDNKLCMNPEHLILGTHAENERDKIERGLVLKGEQQKEAKLTDEIVRSIRLDPRPNREIAQTYGVSKSAIQRIKGGDGWKHVG